jgi:glycosyltransferase involved in cell wall biosynthesis
MRVGQNPAKNMQEVAQPAEITAAVVTYIPFLSGYYQDSLEVLKLCLSSLRDHADLPLDLMVFDNASCTEVRQYLMEEQQAGRLQYLVLSEKNVGKAGAWNHIFGAAPGKYVAYADSDVYFYPGWLTALLKVLEDFPQAGMVTGMPMLTPEEFSTSTVVWAEAQKDVTLERGRFFPWEDFWRHAGSLVEDEAKAREFYEENDALRLNAQGRSYYIGASHFQFVARKQVLQEVLPIPSKRPMGQVRLLDVAINERGYLRLCTEQWHVQHMGNTVPGETFFAGETPAAIDKHVKAARKGLWQLGSVRRLLQKLNEWSFERLYRQ